MKKRLKSNNSLEDELPFIKDEVSDDTISDSERKLANREAKSYSKQRAEVVSQQGLELHKTLFSIARVFIWIFSILFFVLLAIWFLHLIIPSYWQWLNNTEVQTIERILFASTILSFAGKYFAKFKLFNDD